MADRLSNFPYVRVRIVCEPCKRFGNLSLARLAERMGADTGMWTVLQRLTADCPLQQGKGYGKRHAPCMAKFLDLEEKNPPPPDLPRGGAGLQVIEGGKGSGSGL
jgi:hypothetical protein